MLNIVRWYSEIMLEGYLSSKAMGDDLSARGLPSLIFFQDAAWYSHQCTQANRELQRRGDASVLRRRDIKGPLVRDGS
jgi:hypothetical protein